MASTVTMEVLTAEPAVVVSTIQETELPDSPMKDISMVDISRRDSFRRSANQYGATLRRASAIMSPHCVAPAMLTDADFHEDYHHDIENQEMNHDSETGGHFYDCVSVDLNKQK